MDTGRSIRHAKMFYFCVSLCSCVFAENNVQDLIDSGKIKDFFMTGGRLHLVGMRLQSLKGIENLPNPEAIRIIDLSNNQIRFLDGCRFKPFSNLLEELL